MEAIVIDDGSENNEAEIITNNFISQTEIPITYKKKKNGGPSSARNLGISLAKGEFILFIDSDDELLSNSLEWREEILDSIDKD